MSRPFEPSTRTDQRVGSVGGCTRVTDRDDRHFVCLGRNGDDELRIVGQIFHDADAASLVSTIDALGTHFRRG